jgi:hypothetical protein
LRRNLVKAAYQALLEIDEDVLEEYWVGIRNKPENVEIKSIRAKGKYKNSTEPGAGLDGEDYAARQLTVVCLTCRSNKSDFGP